MKPITLLIVLAALVAGCSFGPENACDRYGFQRGTTAFSQCVQNEVLAYQQRLATQNK